MTALMTLALLALTMAGSAAASAGSGEVTLTLKPGGEHSLLQQGVKASYSAKAGKTGATKRLARKAGATQTVSLPVADVELREAATVRTGGALMLALKGQQASLTGVTLQIGKGSTAISAKLGGKRVVFFRAKGESQIDGSSVKLRGAKLSLTGNGAKTLRGALGLEKLSSGRIGTVDVDAKLEVTSTVSSQPAPPQAKEEQPTPPPVDPCAMDVTSTVEGSAAAPASAPVLDSPADATGGRIDWSFSTGLQGYIIGSGGALVPIAPATMPSPPVGSFRFPIGSGAYAVNDAENSADDKAIFDGAGEVRLCNVPHGFTVTLSNPTVTIDGGNSRLTVDVETNMNGVHTPAQRVDLATLDIGAGPFYDENGRTLTWSNLPVHLTAAGEEALQLCDPHVPGPCGYEEGDALDPLTLELKTGAGVRWPFKAACDMPQMTNTTSWPPAPAPPLATPALSSPVAVSSGRIDWGFRNGLRFTVQNMGGQFNLFGGATESNPGAMAGEGKYFRWPGASGEYEASASGPGRLVLQGTGTVGICQPVHGFGTVFSNPTVVIDGASSRLSMDVASRVGLSWTSGRVDLASLAIGGVIVEKQPDTPGPGEETVTWTFPDPGVDETLSTSDDDKDSAKSTVKLLAPGTSALWLLGTTYRATDLPLNKLTVSIVRPTS